MFDPYAESLSSTGEPPTVQTESSRNNLCASQSICSGHGQVLPSTLTSGSRSRTLSVQEPDSGYEASPSSIPDNQRFFGEQSMAVTNQIDLVQSCNLNADIEFDFEECYLSRFSESESDLDDYDTCQESSSSFPNCNCSRTDSSSTNVTAVSNCDNSRCNSSDLSFNRPSSNPIQVPNQQQSCRISPDIRSRLEHSLGSLLDMYPEARSLPISFSHLQTLGFIPENHHLSWPSHSAHSALNRRRIVALPSPRSQHISLNRDNPRRSRSFTHRSRRQIIDSEASSFCSSDEEGPEDVFNMSAEEPSVSVVTVGSVPLPDIVLESTDSVRRGRSVSVNLPLDSRDEVIRDIGQRLRRMSDLFDQRRELCIAVMHLRSRRASDCFDSRPNGVS